MVKNTNALINVKKEETALINIEDNKKCNINVTVNQLDELSYDNIRRNYEDVVTLENEYSDRLEFGKNVLTKKLLPKQLQSDFEIVPRYGENKVEFETKAITSDAYDKFPLKINYTMQFKDVEEARKFRKDGLNKLIEEAERTGKPIEVPNIINMREFIGEYENPVGYANKHGCEGIKLYVCPTPLPPAQKYKIEIFNSDLSFNIETKLRLKNRGKDKVVLTNKESVEEPFNVTISLTNIITNGEKVAGRFNVTISLREKYKNNCQYCKEIIKYKFLIEDSNNYVQISNVDLNTNVFYFENCGTIIHKDKDYKNINKLIDLIDKVIFISKVKNVNVSFDLDHFLRNEQLINLLYSECNSKKYTVKKSMTFSSKLPINDESEKFCNQKNKFNMTSELCFADLFGTRINLKPNIISLNNCSIVEFTKKNDNYNVKIEASNIKFCVKRNK